MILSGSSSAHSNRAQYSCNMCNKKFVSPGGLKYHADGNVCAGKVSRSTTVAAYDMSDASALPSAQSNSSAAAFADQMTCIPSSNDKDEVFIAGKHFSKKAFSTWNIQTIEALAMKYSNDGAIRSTYYRR